jgi:hypothetical protein
MRKILKDEGKTFKTLSSRILSSVAELDDSEFSVEKAIFNKVFAGSQEAMAYIAKHAISKNNGHVLQSCKDFLDLSACTVVAWRLMESAKVAKAKLADSSINSDEKAFLETKIVDFKIYCSQYLNGAVSLAKSITSVNEDMLNYPL